MLVAVLTSYTSSYIWLFFFFFSLLSRFILTSSTSFKLRWRVLGRQGKDFAARKSLREEGTKTKKEKSRCRCDDDFLSRTITNKISTKKKRTKRDKASVPPFKRRASRLRMCRCLLNCFVKELFSLLPCTCDNDDKEAFQRYWCLAFLTSPTRAPERGEEGFFLFSSAFRKKAGERVREREREKKRVWQRRRLSKRTTTSDGTFFCLQISGWATPLAVATARR